MNTTNSNNVIDQNKAIEKKRVVDQLREMPIVEVACRRAGIGRATYYRWLKKDTEFARLCREALEHSTAAVSDIAEAKLITAIQEGNMTAISFWLRNRHTAYQTKVNLNGTIEHKVEQLTPEQEVTISKALRLAGLLTREDDQND